jgi:hypothetical protein
VGSVEKKKRNPRQRKQGTWRGAAVRASKGGCGGSCCPGWWASGLSQLMLRLIEIASGGKLLYIMDSLVHKAWLSSVFRVPRWIFFSNVCSHQRDLIWYSFSFCDDPVPSIITFLITRALNIDMPIVIYHIQYARSSRYVCRNNIIFFSNTQEHCVSFH